MMRGVVALSVVGACAAFQARAPVAVRPSSAVPKGALAANTVALAEGDAASVAKIAASIPIEAKADQSWLESDGETIMGQKATLFAYDAPGPANVAWLSQVHVEGVVASVTIYNGPLTDVPHLVSRCAVRGDACELLIDWRPRTYAAYETRDAAGEYPPPASRDAFTQAGARTKFANAFYTAELEAFVQSLAFDGATLTPPTNDMNDVLARGPLTIDLTMPATDANLAKVAAARATAVDFWLQWMLDPSHTLPPGMKVTSTYAYDTKLRANLYGALLGFYGGLVGAEATKLAAADAGPLDEAYVGGAS